MRGVVRRYLMGRIEAKVASMMSRNRQAGPVHDQILDVRVIDTESRPPREP